MIVSANFIFKSVCNVDLVIIKGVGTVAAIAATLLWQKKIQAIFALASYMCALDIAGVKLLSSTELIYISSVTEPKA